MDAIELWQVGIAVALFLVGVGLGMLLRRGDAATKRRVGVLEAELAEARRLAEERQASVDKHFEKTSEIFRDLTENYTALYGHLAEGARSLCPDLGPALGRGLNNPLLEVEAGLDTERPAASEASEEATPPRTDPADLSGLDELEPLDDLEDLTHRVAGDPQTTLGDLYGDDLDETLPEPAEARRESDEAKAS